MAEIQTTRNGAGESVENTSAIKGASTVKLVKSQTSSVDIRMPSEKTLDPLVMEIIREDMENAKEQRSDFLDYLWKSNSESNYMSVTRLLNRDGNLTDAERIVHSLYGYEIAKETIEELEKGKPRDESLNNLAETVGGGLGQISTGNQELKAAVDSGLIALQETLSAGFSKSETSSTELCARIEAGFKTLDESILRMEKNMAASAGKVSESLQGIGRSLSQLVETMEKNTGTMARIMEEGIKRLAGDSTADSADEAKPSHKKK